MKEKTIKLYEYSELSAKAKEKALAKWRENLDTYAVQVALDNHIEGLLEKHGIKPTHDVKGYESKWARIYWSLSHSQGDGAMFEGVFTWKQYTVRIKHSGRYYHSNSKTIEIEGSDGLGHYDESEYEKLYKDFEEIYQEICKELQRFGYEAIEDEESEGMLIEACNANEWTFREDGTMENV